MVIVIKYHTFASNEEETDTESEEASDDQDQIAQQDNSQDEISEAAPEESKMPVMSGTSLETVEKAAKKYDVSELFDEDFGHGTRCKSLADSSWGLTIDVIYSSATKELLSASIVTNMAVKESQQRKFIKEMSSVICPSSDVDTVSDWVSSNVGSTARTTINGFTYEVGLGPQGNAFYYAGNEEWENWEMQLQ